MTTVAQVPRLIEELSAELSNVVDVPGLAFKPTGTGRFSLGPGPDLYQRVVPFLVGKGGRLSTLVATDERSRTGDFLLRALVMFDHDGLIVEVRQNFSGRLPVLISITRYVPAAHWQEREVAEMFGFELVEHPEPYRHLQHEHTAWDYHPLRKDVSPMRPVPTAAGRPPPFRVVSGEGIHEIPVGPIHAGIIEPGHFRFFALGEKILHLQIRLGYQHKGVEKLFEGRRPADGTFLAERISGDSAFAHAYAYCLAIEDLANVQAPPRAAHLRALALELERLANHVGDLGGLCTDIGFAYGASHFGRLRAEFLNKAEALSGNRFLMGYCCPGGVKHGIDETLLQEIKGWIPRVRADFSDVADHTFSSETVIARMEQVGILSGRAARAFGMVGPAARASGIAHDTRRDFSLPPYQALGFEPAFESSQDVTARARIRHREALHSMELILHILRSMPSGPIRVPLTRFAPDRLGLGQVEGWRGEIVTCVIVDDEERLWRVRVRDPSVQNWIGLALAAELNTVSDFPLCNKSFNLSYSGNDL